MMGVIFMDLLIALGCAIILGLIIAVLAITYWIVKIIAQAAKEVETKKTLPVDTSIMKKYTSSLETSDDAKKS